MRRRPAGRNAPDQHSHVAMLGELDRIGQQVLQNLLQTLGVGGDDAQVAIYLNAERKTFLLRLMAERTGDGVLQETEADLFGLHRNRARLDLRKVENVAYQVEKVAARVM